MKKILISLAICCCLLGCKVEDRIEQNNIVAVWKHEVNKYSATIQNGNQIKDIGWSIRYNITNASFIIIADVPPDKPMWYKAHYHEDFLEAGYDNVEIHIHSVDDINGAGWDHGKFGSGMLEKVN